uniref:DUF2271 domain-containing protein n=1 Tax=Candidatus Caldatribacterium californiense TaxID=1454726 RepID=A0A7V4DH71_9BACT
MISLRGGMPMRKVLLFGIALLMLSVAQGEALEIRYLGHSAFFLAFERGLRCVLDPFTPQVGYHIPEKLEAHALISSHEHFDHFFEDFLGKRVPVFVGTKHKGADWNLFDETIQGVHVFALPSYHDEEQGALRGKNAIIVLEGDGLRLAHLGDIGAPPEESVREKLRGVDILFVPVGGNYTLPLDQVVELIRDLAPRVVIPMHYRTEVTRDWPIAPLADFLLRVQEWKVEKKGSVLRMSRDTLPEPTTIWILEKEGPSMEQRGVLEITLDFERQRTIASNQYAVWIEDEEGNLVKTLYVTRFTGRGGYRQRPDCLPTWVKKANPASLPPQTVDAITSATPQSGRQMYTWDGKDENGHPVPPGTYRFFVEATLFWSSRVLFSGTFAYGEGSVEDIPITVEYFGERHNEGMITNVRARVVPSS